MQTIQLYSSLWHSFWAGNSFQDNSASNLIRRVQTTFVPSCPWFTHKVSHHCFLVLHPRATFSQTPKPSSADRSHIAQTQVLFPSLWWSSSMWAFSILQTKQTERTERERINETVHHFLTKWEALRPKRSTDSCFKQSIKPAWMKTLLHRVKQKPFVWISQESRSILIMLPSPFWIWFDSAWFCGKENSFSACHH